jgi:hypothetical protein
MSEQLSAQSVEAKSLQFGTGIIALPEQYRQEVLTRLESTYGRPGRASHWTVAFPLEALGGVGDLITSLNNNLHGSSRERPAVIFTGHIPENRASDDKIYLCVVGQATYIDEGGIDEIALRYFDEADEVLKSAGLPVRLRASSSFDERVA